jgi:hypothetical protein
MQRPLVSDRLQLLAEGCYSENEVATIQQLLDDGLMEGRSPREVKCLINQYCLAKMILLVRCCDVITHHIQCRVSSCVLGSGCSAASDN